MRTFWVSNKSRNDDVRQIQKTTSYRYVALKQSRTKNMISQPTLIIVWFVKLQHFSSLIISTTTTWTNTYGWYAFNLAKFSSSAADCFTNGVVSLGAMVWRIEWGAVGWRRPPVFMSPKDTGSHAIHLPAIPEGDEIRSIRFHVRQISWECGSENDRGVRVRRDDSFVECHRFVSVDCNC